MYYIWHGLEVESDWVIGEGDANSGQKVTSVRDAYVFEFVR